MELGRPGAGGVIVVEGERGDGDKILSAAGIVQTENVLVVRSLTFKNEPVHFVSAAPKVA